MKPIILTEKKHTIKDLTALKKSNKIWEEIDIYNDQLIELYEILNPANLFDPTFKSNSNNFVKSKSSPNKLNGSWVYFPWNGNLIHMVTESDYFKIRTNRNLNIITESEQTKLYNSRVGVLGLSIGNGMAVSMAYNGIANNLSIADNDILSSTNLNRIRASLVNVGTKKIDITAQQIYEMNPFAKLNLFLNGVKLKNISSFMGKQNKLDLIFEAIDDFEMKIRIRMVAKELKIPVIMLTNLGDSLLIDIERYDIDKKLGIFNGLIGKTAKEILSKPITEEDKQKYALAIVGKENVPKRVFESVMEVNKTLVGRPQIMSTVAMGGGFAAYLARKILLGESVKSGRRRIAFDDIVINE